MTNFVYLDTETTGLDPDVHQVWEIAYAVDDQPIERSFVPHQIDAKTSPEALKVGGYADRYNAAEISDGEHWEYEVSQALVGATLVGANPAFDAAFLRKRWGVSPWHHRLLDVEAYAMGALGYKEPKGLSVIADDLRARGYEIPAPDHTAAADVECVRACHKALREIYGVE